MKGKVATLAMMTVLCVLVVHLAPGPALACFNPTDSFASEVLLNKPGVSYDLSGVSQAESVNVTWEEELTFEGELVSSVPDLIIDTVAEGSCSACKEEEYQVIRSQTEWEELWDKIVADITPKPDRHLTRLADSVGYPDVQLFCKYISLQTGDSVPVVDLVLWRFASTTEGYLDFFRNAAIDDIDRNERAIQCIHTK